MLLTDSSVPSRHLAAEVELQVEYSNNNRNEPTEYLLLLFAGLYVQACSDTRNNHSVLGLAIAI